MMRTMVVVGAVGLAVEGARGMVVAGIRRGVDGGDGFVLMSLYCGSYGHFTLYVLIWVCIAQAFCFYYA